MAPRDYVYQAAAQRVVGRAGCARELHAELVRLGVTRSVLVSTQGQRALAEKLAVGLGDLTAGVLPMARVHVPAEVVGAALVEAQALHADSVIAVGGGSSVGLAKALAQATAWPIVALPTTYAGSEATPIYGITFDGAKRTGRDARVLPSVVLLDPELSQQLPVALSVASSLNGMAHAIEALYAKQRSPAVEALAIQGLRLFTRALSALPHAPDSLETRGDLHDAAWLCGHVLGQSHMGLHHQLCHALGGRFDLPHAELHALILPHVLALTMERSDEVAKTVVDAMGVEIPVAWLTKQAADAGLPTSLRAWNVPLKDADALMDKVLAAPYPHPVPIDRSFLTDLLRRVFG